MNEDRVTGTAEELAGKAESAFGDMTGATEAQAGGRAREMGGKAQNLYGQAKDAARDAAGAAADYAKDIYNNRGETLRNGSEALAQKVQDNPLGSIITAGAIGFALALWMSRPSRRRQSRWRQHS
ncbi:MAG: CsbD family protein [Bradyrhizobium sp.]|nr:CsbD family protein [Bradyrhizobium sp.]